MDNYGSASLDELDLSVRSHNALFHYDCKTVGDVIRCFSGPGRKGKQVRFRIKNFGKRSAIDVAACLLSFTGTVPPMLQEFTEHPAFGEYFEYYRDIHQHPPLAPTRTYADAMLTYGIDA